MTGQRIVAIARSALAHEKSSARLAGEAGASHGFASCSRLLQRSATWFARRTTSRYSSATYAARACESAARVTSTSAGSGVSESGAPARPTSAATREARFATLFARSAFTRLRNSSSERSRS